MFRKKSQLFWLITALAGLVFASAPTGVKAWTPKDVFFMVADINPGGYGYPESITPLDGKLYFGADGGTFGEEFWVYDPALPDSPGTNPKQIADISTGSGDSNPFLFHAYQGKLYFKATTSAAGTELYVYDPSQPTSGSNPLLVNLVSGSGSSDPFDIIGLGPHVYFQGWGTGIGKELWRYPISGGAPQAIDYPKTGPGDSDPRDLALLNGKLFFSADDVTTGRELWVFDPGQAISGANPSLVWDIAPLAGSSDPRWMTAMEGKLYFSAEAIGGDSELWVFDPSLPSSGSNPHQIADIWPGGGGAQPWALTPMMDALYFSAITPTYGSELWAYYLNEPESGTNPRLVADINPGFGYSQIGYLVDVEGVLYFQAGNATDRELFRYDPGRQVSSTNPIMVADINPGIGWSNPSYLTFLKGLLYFSAFDGADGELFAIYPTKLFADGFESGDTKAWSKTVGRKEVFEDEGKCKLCVTQKGALFDKYSLKVKAVNKKPHYVQDDSPDKTNRYRARFYVKLKGLKMAPKNNFKILLGKQGKKAVFFLQVRRKGKRFQIRGALRTNGGKMRKTKWVKLLKKSTPVEFDWAAAESIVPQSGYFRLSINDKQAALVENVNNSAVRLNSVRLGIAGKIKPAFIISGSILLDAFDSDGLFRIGP